MFQARFAETRNTVNQFAGKVVALIVIKSLFEYGVVVEAAHGYGAGTFHLFNELFFKFCGTHSTTQSSKIFVEERSDGQFEVGFCIFQHFGKFFAGVLTHQLQGFCAVCGLHQLLQRFVTLFFRFTFLVHHLATDQDEYSYTDEGDDRDVTSIMEYESYEETDGEGSSGSDEPATDDA